MLFMESTTRLFRYRQQWTVRKSVVYPLPPDILTSLDAAVVETARQKIREYFEEKGTDLHRATESKAKL